MKRVLLPAVFRAVVFFAGATGIASADQNNGVVDAFLCPIVGDGVINAADTNGDNGVAVITPPAGTSLLPAGSEDSNGAGTHANAAALNPGGPGDSANNPGVDNPDFTPIWPGW